MATACCDLNAELIVAVDTNNAETNEAPSHVVVSVGTNGAEPDESSGHIVVSVGSNSADASESPGRVVVSVKANPEEPDEPPRRVVVSVGANKTGLAKNKMANPSPSCNVGCSLNQGDESLPDNSLCTPTYSYPACVKLSGDWGNIGFISASYIYWFCGQEGMGLATLNPFSGGMVDIPEKGKTIFQSFTYNSGFKAGLGVTHLPDDWILRFDYTHLHAISSIKEQTSLPEVLYITGWFLQLSTAGTQALAATYLKSHWHVSLNWIDGTLNRLFYEGRKWVASFYSGVRSAWINQSLKIELRDVVNVTSPSPSVTSSNLSNSWGIGPRAGLTNQWLINYGLRFESNLGASLLFTKYTRVKHKETPAAVSGTPVSYAFKDYKCLRPMIELGLGFGWGCYSSKHGYHFDLSTDYDFNYLWSQNMIRVLDDEQIRGVNGSANPLYLHGLTVTARFDF